MNPKKKKKTKIILGITLPLLALGGVISVFPISNAVIHSQYRIYTPTYAKIDIAPILAKEEKTEEDYATLLSQTGITKRGIDDRLSRGMEESILADQEDFFTPRTSSPYCLGPFLYEQRTEQLHKEPTLRAGDILIDSNTHWGPFQAGHSAMALDDDPTYVFALDGYGFRSNYDEMINFTHRAGYTILRPKADRAIVEKVTQFTKDNLFNIPYDIFAGCFGPRERNTIPQSNCSHILWYAYYQFGIDIDGGTDRIITPMDFLASDQFDVVQVVGIDPSTVKQ